MSALTSSIVLASLLITVPITSSSQPPAPYSTQPATVTTTVTPIRLVIRLEGCSADVSNEYLVGWQNGVDWRSELWGKIGGEFRRKCSDMDLASEPQLSEQPDAIPIEVNFVPHDPVTG
jgi:hypothetical protein